MRRSPTSPQRTSMPRARRAVLVMALVLGIAALFASPQAAVTVAGSSARRSELAQRATKAVPSDPVPLLWLIPPLDTPTFPPRINAIAFDPATPGTGLAATFDANGAVLRTTDHGSTWARLTSWSGVPGSNFHVSAGEQPGVYYAWSGQSVHKTTTSGDAWTQFTYPVSCGAISTLVVDPTQPSTLYIGTSFGFAWSTTGGQTWQHCFAGGPIADVISVGVDQPDVIYAGLAYNNGGGVWRSPDRGVTWSPVSTGLPKTIDSVNTDSIIQLIVDPQHANTVFALTAPGAVYTTSNSGGQWTALNQGIDMVQLRWLARDPATANLEGVSDDHIYTLAVGAASWQLRPSFAIPQPASSPQPPRFVFDPADPDRLIVYHEDGIYVGVPVRSRVLVPLIRLF